MTLNDMITEFRLQVPMAVDAGISDSVLTNLLNRGVIEVNTRARVFFDFAEFTATVNKRTYKISEIDELDDYLGIGQGIIYYKNDNDKYVEIYPRTKNWFSESINDWRTSSSGDPQYYYIDGDELTFDRPFSTARTIRFDEYLKKPTAMGSGNHYPWTGSTTEITAFIPLDQAIITYAKYKVQPTLGKDEQGRYQGGSSYKEFLTEVFKGRRMVKKRPDLYYLGINKMRVA